MFPIPRSKITVLFLVTCFLLGIAGNVQASPIPATEPAVPTFQSGGTVDDLLKQLANLYPTHQKPPIVMVHGWQGANIGLSCQRHDDSYVDENWALLDEDLGAGETLEEPVGSGQTRIRNGLGFHIEIARLYSGGAMSATGPSDPDYHCTPVAEENVPNLIEAIDNAIADTGQEKVILVAHSMGGLVSRAYLESSFYRDDVVALFTLGTPHIGVPVDVLGAWVETISLGLITLDDYCVAQPVVCQFADDESAGNFPAGFTGIETFNANHNQRADGVYYHLLGGDANFDDRGWFGSAMDAIISGPDDGIVPLASALGESSWDGRLAPLSGDIDRLFVFPTMHIEAFTDDPNCLPGEYVQRHYSFHGQDEWSEPDLCLGSDFLNRYIPSESFLDCLSPSLNGRTNDHVCGTVSSLLHAPGLARRMPARIVPAYGVLQTGETVTHAVWVEGGELMLAGHGLLQGRDGSLGTLEITLIAPDGSIIDADVAAKSDGEILYKADENAGMYWFTNAAPGQYQIEITATSAPVDGIRYATMGFSQTNVTVDWGTEQGIYRAGEQPVAHINLSGIKSATIQATLNAGEHVETITFEEATRGAYAGTFAPIPANFKGYAQLTFVINGINNENVRFERQVIHLLPIASNSFQLAGNYQAYSASALTSNAVLQDLLVGVDVTATDAGTIGVSADLADEAGIVVASTHIFEQVNAGNHTLNLRFRGEKLKSHTQLTLTNLRLVDHTNGGIILDTIQPEYSVQLAVDSLQSPIATSIQNPKSPIINSIDDSIHSCTTTATGPFSPNDTITLNFDLTTINGIEYAEWLDYYFVDMPNGWSVQTQSTALADDSGWNRPTGTNACDSIAFWGLTDPDILPLASECNLSLTNLPTSGSFAGPWGELETYTTFFEGFEGSFPPAGWQNYVEENNGGNIAFERSTARSHSGNASAYHHWRDVGWWESNPKSWLVSPPLTIEAGDKLVFWQNGNYVTDIDEHYVYIGHADSNPPTDIRDSYDDGYTPRIVPPNPPEDAWARVEIDLTDYAGRNDVYIAWYYEGDNADGWYIDDVAIERLRLADRSYNFDVTFAVDSDPANSCPGSPYVGVSSDPLDDRAGLVGVAMGDLVEASISTATCGISSACPLPATTLDLTVSNDGSCAGNASTTIYEGDEATFCYNFTNNSPSVTVITHTIDNSLIHDETISLTIAPNSTASYSVTTTVTQTSGCHDNIVNWTAETLRGLGQPQGSGANVPFIDTTYNAVATDSAEVCVQALVAPHLDPALAVSPTLDLSWSGGVACGYSLYESTTPYFDTALLTPIATFAGTVSVYNVPISTGDPALNHYYIIRAENCSGNAGSNSNEVGEFDFTIVPGT